MKKALLSLAILLVIAAHARADSYLLVMSKDDNVGQHMYKLINQDMEKHGKFIPENHEEYNQIKWDSDLKVYARDFEGPVYDGWNRTGKMAVFDINNDEKDETVLFQRASLSTVMRDSLSILPLDYYPRFKKKIYYYNIVKDRIFLNGGGSISLKSSPLKALC